MNIPLLRKIQNAIKAEPLRLDMASWLRSHDQVAPCNTTACIAGFAVTLSQVESPETHIEKEIWQRLISETRNNGGDLMVPDKAQELLEISSDQANVLFFSRRWPQQFRYDYEILKEKLDYVTDALPYAHALIDADKDNLEKARELRKQLSELTVQRIDYFIGTGL